VARWRQVFDNPEKSAINAFWRGHLLLFDRPASPLCAPTQGRTLLWIFLGFEGVVRPVLDEAGKRLALVQCVWWPLAETTLLTGLSCAILLISGIQLSQIGLRPWRLWSKTEKLYFVQIVPITICVFSFVEHAELKVLWARPDLEKLLLFVFVPKMLWGFYQELLYRGLLQTESVRRWGSTAGIVASNLVFTFGPLHAYHFRIAQKHPAHLWIFVGIFSIGLFFALIYLRSGNLWVIGVMHGLGDWFIDGLSLVTRPFR
jgi:membrane protease YdiL (CAAX protease family)